MRYVELNDGHVLLAPRRAISHGDMIGMCGVGRGEVKSAGFVSLGYSESDGIEVWGASVSLGKESRQGVVIPSQLWGAVRRLLLVFSSNRELLAGLEEVEEAQWGMTAPSPWGEVTPVYAPLHSTAKHHAADYVLE